MIKKLVSRGIGYFINLKLRQKMLLSYILLIIIPLILFSVITYRRYTKVVEGNILFSAGQSFSQANAYVSDKLNRIIKVLNVIILDETTNNVVSSSTLSGDVFKQLEDRKHIIDLLSSLEDGNEITKIWLYVRDGLIYSNEDTRSDSVLSAIQGIRDTVWYTRLMNGSMKILWCPPSYIKNNVGTTKKILSAITPLRYTYNFQGISGLLRVDFRESMIREIISRADTIQNSLTYIQNSQGDIVTSSDDTRLKDLQLELRDVLKPSDQRWTTIRVHGEEVFYQSKLIVGTDWYMVTVIPYREVFAESNRIRKDTFIQVFFIATLAYVLAYLISITITKRISSLIKQMKDVQDGNLHSIIRSSHKDEVGELVDNYNFMIQRITCLMEEQFKSGIEVKNAELKALQTQINPHFLYNTLDMIIYLSQDGKYSEIESTVRALAKFYKLSLNKGKEAISIKDELLHVDFYVQIQNMRYANKITLNVEVDSALQEFSILKITLQPIVENAILHGILCKPEKEGTISIKGRLEEDIIFLGIQDDGVGIPEDSLRKIESGSLRSKTGSGYGLKNINDRIKLYYGENYGLSYTSTPGKGTKVEVRIPAVLPERKA